MHDQAETTSNPTEAAAPAPDFDSPWKEAMDAWFQPFMALFFPAVHDLIDWTRPHEFLDAELQRLTGDSEIGRRTADRLVRVYSREGQELWLLLHIEIQGRADAAFPERMFQYWYRIYDRYRGVEILSLALLTNDRAPVGGGVYRRKRDGYGVSFRFRVHALPDWDQAELGTRAASNPFAVVALAQLAAHRRGTDPERKARKRELIEMLYRFQYDRAEILKLLRFIDWLIRLPRVLEQALRQELIESEEGRKMPYVTSWEQFAREEGLQQGEARALLRLIQGKFGPPAPDLTARVERAELPELEIWLDRILTAATPDEVFDPRRTETNRDG
ncbi:DUF4351 domain-containing protein [Candidatus Thiodictyon syntrophicum]|uniref:Cytosolic protein n=1 Tax=Candidatus Thiodictyon syntrophicum TaxID=1166950 RepID=A0A2K8U4Q5_9GAMM|nr:DUF4351 domain-containing protein [Candidatus Thiodictyon syntrophicum]AUB80573.1 hypothetical protein THSYN_06155 [Candidatus Thiodictyon syntrophicum]